MLENAVAENAAIAKLVKARMVHISFMWPAPHSISQTFERLERFSPEFHESTTDRADRSSRVKVLPIIQQRYERFQDFDTRESMLTQNPNHSSSHCHFISATPHHGNSNCVVID
jgi:hypothetical protein